MAGVVIRTGSLANLDHFDSISVASGSFNGSVGRSESPSRFQRSTYRRKSTSIFNISSQKVKSHETLQALLREIDARREHACCLMATTMSESLQLTIADDCMIFTTDSWRSIVHCAQDLDKKQTEQQEAVWELLVTELQFIQRLNVLRRFYRDTIAELQRRDSTLFPNLDCGKLFDNLDEIFEAHVTFWNKCCSSVVLQARSTGLPLNPALMYNGILQVNKFLECYSSYCAHYQSMAAYLKEQLKEDSDLKLLMSWFEDQPECERQPLAHWLMKPIQRLTKYPILMHAILKKTTNDEHRLVLRHMMDVLEDFVHTINRRVKESDEQEALTRIHDRIAEYSIYDGVTDEISSILGPFSQRQDFLRSPKGTFVKEFAVKVKKVDDQLRRVDSTLLLFSETILICKRLKKQGDRLRIIKPPIKLTNLHLYRLREVPSFLMVIVNSDNIVVEAHVVYTGSITQLDTMITSIMKTQKALATVSTVSSTEDPSSSRHFNFTSYDRTRETTDSPNDTESELDTPNAPYTPVYTPSPRTPITSPTSSLVSPVSPQLARTNAMTSMTRAQLLARRRSRTVSDCPLQHSMSFPPTSATDSPLRHSTTDLDHTVHVLRSSSDQEHGSRRQTLTRQRSASFSSDDNKQINSQHEHRRPTLTRQRSTSFSEENNQNQYEVNNNTDGQTSRKTSLDNYLMNFLEHGATSSVDHSEDELDNQLDRILKSRSDSAIEYRSSASRNSSIHTIPSVESILEENVVRTSEKPQEEPRPLSPSFPRSLRNSRSKINRTNTTDESGTLRKRENAFRQVKRNMHKNKRFLTDSALQKTDEDSGSSKGVKGYYRRRMGSWSERELREMESPVYSTSTSRTSDYDRSTSSDVFSKEATVSRNSSSGISVASKNSCNEKDLENTATLKKNNPWSFPRKLETLMSVRSAKDDEDDSGTTLFAGPGEYCKDLFRGESLDWEREEGKMEKPETFSSVLTINLTVSGSQPNSRSSSARSSMRKQTVEEILDDSDMEITRV